LADRRDKQAGQTGTIDRQAVGKTNSDVQKTIDTVEVKNLLLVTKTIANGKKIFEFLNLFSDCFALQPEV
jgi:hypothetical protein